MGRHTVQTAKPGDRPLAANLEGLFDPVRSGLDPALCQILRAFFQIEAEAAHYLKNLAFPSTSIELDQDVRRQMELVELLRLSLASTPSSQSTVVVTNTPTLLAQNLLNRIVAVKVTNWDNAQTMSIGTSTVTTTNGEALEPRAMRKFQLMPNEAIYGVIGGANINAGVATLTLPRVF